MPKTSASWGRAGLFFQVPLKKLETGWTKERLFKVCILDMIGGTHNTLSVSAVGESEGVSQFMKCGLFCSFQ